jgi:hypothetical protein
VASLPLDPSTSFVAFRFNPVPSDLRVDPVGDTLRIDKDPGLDPALNWSGPPAAGYQVLRCDATSGACVPSLVATTSLANYTDTDATASQLWYLVKAVNECTAGL